MKDMYRKNKEQAAHIERGEELMKKGVIWEVLQAEWWLSKLKVEGNPLILVSHITCDC